MAEMGIKSVTLIQLYSNRSVSLGVRLLKQRRSVMAQFDPSS